MSQPSVVTTHEAIQRLAISADLSTSERQVIVQAVEESEKQGNAITFLDASRILDWLDRSDSSS
jgi:hypothetical protein